MREVEKKARKTFWNIWALIKFSIIQIKFKIYSSRESDSLQLIYPYLNESAVFLICTYRLNTPSYHFRNLMPPRIVNIVQDSSVLNIHRQIKIKIDITCLRPILQNYRFFFIYHIKSFAYLTNYARNRFRRTYKVQKTDVRFWIFLVL